VVRPLAAEEPPPGGAESRAVTRDRPSPAGCRAAGSVCGVRDAASSDVAGSDPAPPRSCMSCRKDHRPRCKSCGRAELGRREDDDEQMEQGRRSDDVAAPRRPLVCQGGSVTIPGRRTVLSESVRVGLDPARNVFQVQGAGGMGRAVLRGKLRRAQVREFLDQLPACVVAMEARGALTSGGVRSASWGMSSGRSRPPASSLWQSAGKMMRRMPGRSARGRGALLHKSGDGRGSPFPGRTCRTASVTGMSSAV